MRIGAWPIGVADIGLALLLVCSVIVGAVTLGEEDEVDTMDDEWIFLNVDSWGNELRVAGASIDSRGAIICDAWPHGTERGFTAIDQNGTSLWRSVTNACPGITEGPNRGYYYVDWNTSDPYAASWSNLTALSPDGEFRWSYVVPIGTLALWAVYPDGQVIVYNYDWQHDLVDRIIAVSDNGTELWTHDSPSPDVNFCYSRICPNGTFSVTMRESNGTSLLGISKDGTQVFIAEGEFLAEYTDSFWGRNETVVYKVTQEFIDNETSVINVSALSLFDGAVEWSTVLHYSDNPDNTSSGVSYLEGTVVDAEGRIYCGDIEGKCLYSLSPNGSILWEKPYYGIIVDAYSAGGFLARDETSIKRVSVDGSLVWRHNVDFDGYSFVLLGDDETVYYSYLAEVHALVHSVAVDGSGTVIVTLLVVDGAAIAAYVTFRLWKPRQTNEV
ncbi:MAG TPA: PQQ-binding-like beta-propeller repeat protein [Thermoplasmata archaeon]|nr:PQQ-binding-like beta-propeller repeat protein [Thermoplasmata archaeon]